MSTKPDPTPARGGSAGTTTGAARLRVGAARTDITPQDLTGLHPMGRPFERVHDPIHLRALVADDGTTEVALISLDLVEAGDMTPVRRRIEAELGIPFDHIVITATHTHSAPRIGDVSPGALAHAGSQQSLAYTATVYDAMLETLRTARASARPATVGTATGSADVNINREVYSDGEWILGFNPEGPCDKAVRVVRFDGLDGRPIALVVNYSVHPTVVLGTGEVSADLAGAACRHVEDHFDEQAVCLWTPGTIGDQAPRVDLGLPFGAAPDARQAERAYRAMEAQGLMVGAEAVRVAEGITRGSSTAPISAGQRTVHLPCKAGVDVMASMRQQRTETVPLRLALIRIGDIALAGVSGEVVTEIGERLREASPLADTLLVSIANDRIGYIADDARFDRPVHSVRGCPIVRGHAEDTIVGGILALLEESTR
ncbi:neutral/alkaline non-lysosomal ceramidase N-terminal domain-containing protein [Streptacidiphilus sp. EB103A]|uniref:neutral/alkaline non-lysosomal ceramidase N-terminal domain-containing protein n=1 Tax=Streptacidiphilus sp. EB103A TaxID=3156275 RepID=UPI003511F3BC